MLLFSSSKNSANMIMIFTLCFWWLSLVSLATWYLWKFYINCLFVSLLTFGIFCNTVSSRNGISIYVSKFSLSSIWTLLVFRYQDDRNPYMDISIAKVLILKFLLINQHLLDTINLKIIQNNLYNYLLIYLSIFSLPQLFLPNRYSLYQHSSLFNDNFFVSIEI